MREGRKKTTTVTASLKNGFLVQLYFWIYFSSIDFFVVNSPIFLAVVNNLSAFTTKRLPLPTPGITVNDLINRALGASI